MCTLAQLCCCIVITEVALNFRIKTSVAKPPFGEYTGESNPQNAESILTAAEGGIYNMNDPFEYLVVTTAVGRPPQNCGLKLV